MNTDLYAEFRARNDGRTPADRFRPREVIDHKMVHDGILWDVVVDEIDLGHSVVRREYLDHPSAVAVIAIPATNANRPSMPYDVLSQTIDATPAAAAGLASP